MGNQADSSAKPAEETAPLVIPLETVHSSEVAAVGRKAVNLARMNRIGMPVPPGFCVTADAYREHVMSGELMARLSEALPRLANVPPDGRHALLSPIREAILALPVSETLAEHIERQYEALGERVAVRSSATSEDLKAYSFAGQYDSVLGVGNVSDCLLAVKRCWASVWSDRAIDYRARHGTGHLDVEMAVIVQALVPADASGVVFTADPVTRRTDRMIIEASFGLGEAVVSGKVTPDRIVLSKSDFHILSGQISEKSIETVLDERGHVQEQAVPHPRAQWPCLDDAAAMNLGRMGVRVEDAFGAPQDIEWAISGGKLAILQSRPITAVPDRGPREDRQVWTNANTGEVLPDVVTPMTWSMATTLIRELFDGLLGRLGLEIGDNPLVGLVAGRVYFNLNTFAGALRRIPVLRKRELGELFGGMQDRMASLGQIKIPEEDIPDLNFHWLRAAVRLPGFVGWLLSLTRRKADLLAARVREDTEAVKRMDLQSLSNDELADRAHDIASKLLSGPEGTDSIGFAGIGLMYSMKLYNLCNRWFGESGNAIASGLLAGSGGMENAESGFDLWRLAALAHEHPEVRDSILGEGDLVAVREKVAEADGGDAFLSAWDAFLSRHGHHTRGEIELANPRWSEEPDYVLDTVRAYLQNIEGADPIAEYRQRGEQSERLAKECRSRLRNPVKRMLFSLVLKLARRSVPIRENLKSEAVRRLAVVRGMLLELGTRLAQEDVLEKPEEIFFLELNEIRPGGDQEGHALDIRGTVAARRAEYERNLTLTPPPVVMGPLGAEMPPPEPVPVPETTTVMTGVAVSPGIARGPARVIERAGTEQVRPGEILVAPFTDPGWTPYFIPAAGLVADMGGLLSHGSIIAREYGLPAVVNVGPATKTIKTGQMIQVDGDRGVVTIL